MPKLKKTQQAGPTLITPADVTAEMAKLAEEAAGFGRDMVELFVQSEHAKLRYGALTWLRDRLVDLGAEQQQLEREAEDAVAGAAAASAKIAPRRDAAEQLRANADEVAACDAKVAELEARKEQLVDARRLAHFENRVEDADKIREQLAALNEQLEVALSRQGALRYNANEADRLCDQADSWSKEYTRLLDLAEEKRGEAARLPDKVAAAVAESEELPKRWAHEKYELRQEPEIPGWIDLSPPQFGVTRDGIHISGDGWIIGRSGAVARVA